jgi:hypothetical protein
MSDTLNPGELLHKGGSISSNNGAITFVLQDDGNLVLYNQSGQPLWATGTNGKEVSQAIMQLDGNFVLYGPTGALWASGTDHYPGSHVIAQDDHNVVVYDPQSKARWATNTYVPPGIQPGVFPKMASCPKTAVDIGYMYVNKAILSASGRFDLELRVQNVRDLVGFTGGCEAVFVDEAGNILGNTGWHTIGVDAKSWPFGSSDRTKSFVDQVDPGVCKNTAAIHFLLECRPQQYGFLNQLIGAGKKVSDVAGQVAAVGSVFA